NTEINSIGKNKNDIKLTEKVAFNKYMNPFTFVRIIKTLSARKINNKATGRRKLSKLFRI
ncbi:MAG: hypothetical protein KAR84_07590, partial [Elusimicrobiales bacterium]|nr:hypothetical protein [Elusimicrobiales bacterium]